MSRPSTKKGWTASKLRREQEACPWLTQKGLIAAVSAVRKHCVCGYRGDRCDCKFGIRVKMVPRTVTQHKAATPLVVKMEEVIDHTSEQTGCPELYVVMDLLAKLTKREFNDLVRRPARTVPKTSVTVVGKLLVPGVIIGKKA